MGSFSLEDELAHHAEFIRVLTRRLVTDTDRADDVAQQTCLAALQARPVPGRGLKSWLGRAARHLAVRRHREETRRRSREALVARPERDGTAEDLLQRTRLLREVVDAVCQLPESYRSVVLLRYYEDLSAREIAERLGIPHATARTRLSRGLAMLRAWFDTRYRDAGGSWRQALVPLAFPAQGLAAAGGALGSAAGVAATPAKLLSGLAFTGGIVVMKKTLAAVVVVAIAAISYVALREGPDSGTGSPSTVAPILPSIDGPGAKAAEAGASRVVPIKPEPFTGAGEDRGGRAAVRPAEARAVVQGRVVDEAGRGLAGVTVKLQFREAHVAHGGAVTEVLPEPQEAETDQVGRFRFKGVRTGQTLRVLARPTELCDADHWLAIAEARDYDIGDLVALAGAGLAGRITDGRGSPIAHAQVSAWRTEGNPQSEPGMIVFSAGARKGLRRATTDDAGRYRIDGLTDGAWVVHTVASGFVRSQKRGVTVRRGSVLWDVDFSLDTGWTARGVVNGPGEIPLAGVRVTASPKVIDVRDMNLGPDEQGIVEGETDEAGRFRLEGLAESDYRLLFRKEGFLAGESGIARSSNAPVLTKLSPAGVVFGRVRDGRSSLALNGLISTNMFCCSSASHGFDRVSSPPPSYSTSRPEVRISG